MRYFIFGVMLSGCVVPAPPAPPTPRDAMAVGAGFGRTWDSAIDVFAERNIAIRTIDRASGLIVAEPMKVGSGAYADCGRTMWDVEIPPTDATWNLLVRGDSTRSTVKATVRFASTSPAYGTSVVCSSRGTWETSLEERIKASAEGKKP